ncbi:MAG TPA: hypothetical protein VLG92_00685 [Candidatus Saccharimonadia bacterium]|nr:hypothetical protein [Candidatus Saccharimonadia bacterium]
MTTLAAPELITPNPIALEAYDPDVEMQCLDLMEVKPTSLPEVHSAVAQAQALRDRVRGMDGIRPWIVDEVDHQADEGVNFYRQSPERLAVLDAVRRGERPPGIPEARWVYYSDESKARLVGEAKRQIFIDKEVARYQKATEISDLVTVDAYGRGHRPGRASGAGKNSKSGGQILSNDAMNQIGDHQEEVRDGIRLRGRAADVLGAAVLSPTGPAGRTIMGLEKYGPINYSQPFAGLTPDLRTYYLSQARLAKAAESDESFAAYVATSPNAEQLRQYLAGHDDDGDEDDLPADVTARRKALLDMIAYSGRSLRK